MSTKIASIIIGLSGDSDERRDATRELLAMTDDLDKVPQVVSSGNLTVALLLMRENKDYYRYIGTEVLMRVWRAGSAKNDVLAHRDFVLGTIDHLLANYDVLSATRMEALKKLAAELRNLSSAPMTSSSSSSSSLTSSSLTSPAPAAADASAARKDKSSKASRDADNKRSAKKSASTTSAASDVAGGATSGASSVAAGAAGLNKPMSVRVPIADSGHYNAAALLAALTPRGESDAVKTASTLASNDVANSP